MNGLLRLNQYSLKYDNEEEIQIKSEINRSCEFIAKKFYLASISVIRYAHFDMLRREAEEKSFNEQVDDALWEKRHLEIQKIETNILNNDFKGEKKDAYDFAYYTYKMNKHHNGEHSANLYSYDIELYRESFIHAFHSIEQGVYLLSKIDMVPKKISEAHSKINKLFPSLRGLRNSIAHQAERNLGYRFEHSGQKIKAKQIKDDKVPVVGSPTIAQITVDDKYHTIQGNGELGGIEINSESIVKMHSVIQEIFDAVKTIGTRYDITYHPKL